MSADQRKLELQARLDKLDEERKHIVCELETLGVAVAAPIAVTRRSKTAHLPRALFMGLIVTLLFSGMVVTAAQSQEEGVGPEPTCTGDQCDGAETNQQLFDRLDTLYKKEQDRQVIMTEFPCDAFA
jgi:hypothetical protein